MVPGRPEAALFLGLSALSVLISGCPREGSGAKAGDAIVAASAGTDSEAFRRQLRAAAGPPARTGPGLPAEPEP